jgi:hypothetical protein
MRTAELSGSGAIGGAVTSPVMPKLLRDTGGQITELALSIPPGTLDDKKFKAAYTNLLVALATSGATLTVVTAKSLKPRVTSWLDGLSTKPTYKICEVDDAQFNASTVWPRDAMLCAIDSAGASHFLHPHVASPGDIATWLAQNFNGALTELEIYLDGGDSLVIDDKAWIVGARAVSDTRFYRVARDWDSAVAKFGEVFGRQTPAIGGYSTADVSLPAQWRDIRSRAHRKALKHNPAHPALARFTSLFSAAAEILRMSARGDPLGAYGDHIDMVVSVTGVVDANNAPIVLVADPTHAACPDRQSSASQDHGRLLGSLASVLTKQGLAVKRNPAPCVEDVVLGCNNTIIQRPDTVWLPTFADAVQSLKSADDENVRIWHQDLQFANVVPVAGWMAYARKEGSIRCATLPLKRR